MKVLPIINVSYDNRTNFKGRSTKAAKQTLPEIGRAVKLGTAAALAYLGVTNKNKSSENDDFQIRELSKNEYTVKKNEIAEHENDFKAFKYITAELINPWNVQLFDYMLQHPEEYDNAIYQDMVSSMTDPYIGTLVIDNKNRAEVALRMLKKPWFLKIGKYASAYGVGSIGHSVSDDEVKNIKIKMLDKLDEYKDKKTFSTQQEIAIVEMLSNIKTQDGLKVALKFLENIDIFDNQASLDNRYFSRDCFGKFSNKKEYADIKIELIDKINSKPELFETPYFKCSTAGIFNNVLDNQTKTFALKVLNNHNLFKSKSFAGNLGNILYYFPSLQTDEKEVLYNILNAIEMEPKLFENNEFLNDLGQLIFIQKFGDSVTIQSNELLKTAKKNLFIIENGYYKQEN